LAYFNGKPAALVLDATFATRREAWYHQKSYNIVIIFIEGLIMLTTMRKVGNSRGVLIPAAFLASCQIEEQVDMELQDGQIVIKPVKRKLRDGWFVQPASSAALIQEAAEAHAWDSASVADDSAWVW
jgi:antitoxin MazE